MIYYVFYFFRRWLLVHHSFLRNFFNIHPNLIFFAETVSDFYRAYIVICVVFVKSLYRSLLYFEFQEEHQEQNKVSSTSLTMNPTTDFYITSSIINRFWKIWFNSIYFLQRICRDTCRFFTKPWYITVVFQGSSGASRTFFKYQYYTVQNMKILGPRSNKKISAEAIDLYPQGEYSA